MVRMTRGSVVEGDSPKEEFKEEFEGDDKDLTI